MVRVVIMIRIRKIMLMLFKKSKLVLFWNNELLLFIIGLDFTDFPDLYTGCRTKTE
jgi:hypothetical protein